MRSRWGVLLLAATCAGAVLRVTALDFGLPDRFRPDEEYVVERAARLGGTWGFNPRFALYPAGQTYLVWGLAHAAQALSGAEWTLADPAGRRRWYLTGRLASAVMGTLTIPLTGLLAARLVAWPDVAGVPGAGAAAALAGVLMAGAFLHARDSHFATTDVAMTFWCVLAWLAIARLTRRARTPDSLAAGALVGLATATKYPAVTLLVPLALAHGSGARRLARLAAASVAVAVVFFAASPWVVLDPATTRAAIGWRRFLEVETAGPGPSWLFREALPAALGWPLAVLALASVLWAVVRGGSLARLLGVWLVVATYPLLTAHMVYIRYALPLFPVALALSGVALTCLASWLPGGLATVSLLAAAVVYPSVARGIAVDRLLAERDTRALAREWMESHLPPDSVVHAPGYIPGARPPNPFFLPEASGGVFRYAAADGAPSGAYVLVAEHPLCRAARPGPNLEAALGRGATLLFEVDPFRTDRSAEPRYETSDAFFVPLSGFGGVERPGPRLRLYRLAS